MKVVSFLLLLFAAAAKGDNCYAGSSYDNINDASEASIDKRYWYLNLDEPFTCSGELKKYEVFYYELDEADYRVQAAIWKPRENEEGVFDLVSSSKKQIRKDNDKRRKRASTDGSDSKGVSNVYTRKGSIIGVYFKSGDTPMPIIGTKSGYSVCKYQDTSYTKTVVNCTSSMQQNTLIHATAEIDILECASSEIVTIQDGNYDLIDGDTEYGARVRYSCNEGYQLVTNGGDGVIMCDENEEWVGTVPSCEIVTCNDINTIPNGVVNGNIFTYQSSIAFTCNPGYDLHGSSSVSCLSNGTWSDTMPTCDIIECSSNVSSPLNGYINMTSITYGSNITFGCDNGYELMGNEISTCQANKQWSGNTPSCNPVDCGDPGSLANAMKNGSIFTFQSVVTFTCNEGYYLSGSSAVACQADKTWNSSNPECIAIICNNPGTPLFGSIDNSMSSLPYASTVSFDCNTGFVLNGSKTLSCVDQNQWNASLPSCELVNCGPPAVNNFTIFTPHVYTYGSTVYFSCITGYESNINDSMANAECEVDGQWSIDPPFCTAVSCGDPGTPVNGSLVLNQQSESFVFNSIIEYSCDEGFQLMGSPAIQCKADKQWNSSMLPTCMIIECSDPGSPVNGVKLGNDTIYTYQAFASFDCDSGYELNGSSSISCTSMGNWSDSLPTCNPVNCGDPTPINNGGIIGNVFTYGNIVHYQCNNGYELSSDISLICTANSTWNSSIVPVCNPVQCIDDVRPENGFTSDSNNTYGSVIWFSCNEGYYINGSMNATCLASGQWSSPVPHCVPVDCGPPIVTDNKTQLNENASYTFGSIVSFTCIDGYEVNGSSSISCQADGNWTNVAPSCSIVNCGEPDTPTNGNYSGTSFTNGSLVQYMCNQGYALEGSALSTCTKTKQWSNDAPYCARICSKPSLPSNLMIVSEKNMYKEGDEIMFKCFSGFDVNGSSVLLCTSNGWSSSFPNCSRIATVAITTTASIARSSSQTILTTTTISGASTNVIRTSTTTLLPGRSSEVQDNSFPVSSVAAAVGVALFVIIVAIIIIVLILLVVRNRKSKEKYDVQAKQVGGQGSTFDNHITQIYDESNPSVQEMRPMARKTVENQQDEFTRQNHGTLTDPNLRMHRTVSEYEVPSTLKPEQQQKQPIPKQDSSYDIYKEDLSVEDPLLSRSASAYEVPATLMRNQQSTASAYEVPATLTRNKPTATMAKKDLSKVDETQQSLDLPPPITDNDILETSFIDGDENDQLYIDNQNSTVNGTENQLYMETDTVPQPPSIDVYSDLENAFETTPNPNDMDSENILYSEIDDVDLRKANPLPDHASQKKDTLTAKRKTVIFQPPAEETNELYLQLKRQGVNGIKPECIFIGKTLGSGYFGNVYKAEMKQDPDDDDTLEVAVKTLNDDNATERDKIKFLQEAAIMAQFDNSNVLKLYGVVVTKKSCMIVTELMANGDLLDVLVKMRPDPGQLINEDMPFTLLNFSRQICLGLSYLSQKGFVHRDIAARNILVNSTNTCKIADFGLSRDLEDDDYYMANEGAKIPVKWTAPEALHYRKYSTASDVWSYGCLLYEIWGLGAKPFQNVTNMQALQKVTDGYRLPPPPGCPKEFYNLMIMCWHPDKDERPAFQELMLSMLMQDKLILAIPEEDFATHPLAGTIGATLKAGDKMYEKLQLTYT